MQPISLKTVKRNSEAYDRNFEKLLKSVGTPEHDKYVAIERKLDKRGVAMRKKLGIFIPDPCPLTAKKDCRDCTGNWTKENRKVIEVVAGGKECLLKNAYGVLEKWI